MGRLDGQAAIVTGAGKGIGRGVARALARQGAAVTVAEINAHGGQLGEVCSAELARGKDEPADPDHAGDVREDHRSGRVRYLCPELTAERVEITSSSDVGPADWGQMGHQGFRRAGADGPLEVLEHVAANTVIDDHGFLPAGRSRAGGRRPPGYRAEMTSSRAS
jgi:NAD(P)-dependent dehydrogenase (short-subunit alcohol dehydrogenase family)